jgi:hypothetical protein
MRVWLCVTGWAFATLFAGVVVAADGPLHTSQLQIGAG